MKTCFKCGEEKPLDEFYAHPSMRDGRAGKCKECTKKDVVGNRAKHIDYYREYDRARGNRQGYGYTKEYRSQNPEKARAHRLVNHAVRRGKIEKMQHCQECGDFGRTEAHHEDYSRPLEVVWLCSPCHRAKHKRKAA